MRDGWQPRGRSIPHVILKRVPFALQDLCISCEKRVLKGSLCFVATPIVSGVGCRSWTTESRVAGSEISRCRQQKCPDFEHREVWGIPLIDDATVSGPACPLSRQRKRTSEQTRRRLSPTQPYFRCLTIRNGVSPVCPRLPLFTASVDAV